MKYYFQCPKCRSDGGFSLPSEEPAGLGFALFILGGLIPFLVYADSQRRRVQCDHCGHLFRQPPLPRTATAKLATAILVVQIITALAVVSMVVWPELADAIPAIAWVEHIATALSGQIVPLLLLAVASFSLTVLICLIASIGSSLAQRRTMSKSFQIRVEERGVRDQQRPAADAVTGAGGASLGTMEE